MCHVWKYALATAFVCGIAFFATNQLVRLSLYYGGL